MRLKWKIGLLAGAAVVLVGGASVLSATQDATWLRTRVVAAIEQSTGRQLSVGHLHVWLLPFPWVEARDVRLSGVEEGGPDMLRAETVRARLALAPLFHHRIVLDDVSITNPHVVLRRLADGRADWAFTPKPASLADAQTPAPSGPAGGQLHWNFGLTSLQVSKGDVQWQDSLHNRSGYVPVESLKLNHLEGEKPALEAILQRDKGRVTLTAQTGRLAPVMADSVPVEAKLVFQLDGHPAGLAHLDGTVSDPAGKRGYALSFGGSLGQLQNLEVFFPHAGLPQGQNISVDGLIGGEGKQPLLQSLHARAGQVDLTQLLPAAILSRLTLDANNPDEALAIVLEGKLGAQSLTLRGGVGTLAQVAAIAQDPLHATLPADLTLTDGESNLHVSGTLGAAQSGLDVHGALAHVALGENNPTLEDLKIDGHLDAQNTLSLVRKHTALDMIRGLNGALDVQAPHFAWRGQSWSSVVAHVAVQNARLSIDPIKAESDGIQQSGHFVYDAAGAVPQLDVSARPVLLPLGVVQQVVGAPALMRGTLALVGTVSAHGANATALQQSAVGHIGASVVDGEIGGAALRTLLGPQVPLKGKMPVRCFGTHLQVADGTATFDLIGLETDFLSLHGHGTVGLGTHTLDLHLSPRLALGGASAGSDVRVTGTFAAPVPKMEPTYSGQYGITIGGDDGGGDNCPTLLSAAREGAAGPTAKAPEHGKGGKVMNMLRGLGLFQ